MQQNRHDDYSPEEKEEVKKQIDEMFGPAWFPCTQCEKQTIHHTEREKENRQICTTCEWCNERDVRRDAREAKQKDFEKLSRQVWLAEGRNWDQEQEWKKDYDLQ